MALPGRAHAGRVFPRNSGEVAEIPDRSMPVPGIRRPLHPFTIKSTPFQIHMYPCAIFPQRPGEQSGRSGHLRRFSRILAAGLAVLAFASAAPCLAQTDLVSNMSETNTADGARVYSSGGQATFIAQEFTTGSNADGYLLSEVVVNVIVDDPVHYDPGTPVFTLHESTPHTDGNPIPGEKTRRSDGQRRDGGRADVHARQPGGTCGEYPVFPVFSV